MFAAKNESAQALAVVERLLKAGADVNAADDVSGWERGSVGCLLWGLRGYIDTPDDQLDSAGVKSEDQGKGECKRSR